MNRELRVLPQGRHVRVDQQGGGDRYDREGDAVFGKVLSRLPSEQRPERL